MKFTKRNIWNISNYIFVVMMVCLFACAACNRTKYREAGSREELTEAGIVVLPTGSSEFAEEWDTAIELMEAKKYDDAISIFQDLLRKEKESQLPAVNISMASMYALKQQPEIALQYYQTAWRLDTTNILAIEALGGGYYQVGNYGEAIHYSLIAAQRAPERPDCHYTLAACYYMLGMKAPAVEQAKIFIALVPDSQYRINMDNIIAYFGE